MSSASSSGFQHNPAGWSWPDDLPQEPSESPEASPIPTPTSEDSPPLSENTTSSRPHSESKSERRRYYKPRQCRICLDVVHPTFSQPLEHVPAFLQSEPKASYISEDGRLISPCKCKGSSRYVHESCLQEWRHADPSYGRRHYYECPTCHFQYRLERVQWGNWLKSQVAQVFLTLIIFLSAVFILGFIADPIIELYLDPWNIIESALPFAGEESEHYGYDTHATHLPDAEGRMFGWLEHFLKGFTSLGLLGSLKVLFSQRIFDWINLRNSGIITTGRRAGQTGRDRFSSFTWIMVITGILTFVYTVWKFVRSYSRRVLEKAGERVMDVQGGDVDDVDDDDNADEEEETRAELPKAEHAQAGAASADVT